MSSWEARSLVLGRNLDLLEMSRGGMTASKALGWPDLLPRSSEICIRDIHHSTLVNRSD